MRIKLHFPPESIAALARMGLRQRMPETLRWSADPSRGSSYGLGVLLRGKSGEGLSGHEFAAMHYSFGAWIEVDDAVTKRRVENALATVATGLDAAIRIAPSSDPAEIVAPP